jgi:hypothetical protein
MLIGTGINLFLLHRLRIPSLFHYLLRPMKSPPMVTTELQSADVHVTHAHCFVTMTSKETRTFGSVPLREGVR